MLDVRLLVCILLVTTVVIVISAILVLVCSRSNAKIHSDREQPAGGGVRVLEGSAASVRVTARRSEATAIASVALTPVERERLKVDRDCRPLWQVRGWRKQGNKLVGAYRTPAGSFVGEIVLDHGTYPEFFILHPPSGVLKGSHRACFIKRRRGFYFIHFSQPVKSESDIDGAIIRIEQLIRQSL